MVRVRIAAGEHISAGQLVPVAELVAVAHIVPAENSRECIRLDSLVGSGSCSELAGSSPEALGPAELGECTSARRQVLGLVAAMDYRQPHHSPP